MQNIPILILHGWNLSSDKYQPLQRELLAKNHKVYSVDLPGFGKAKTLTRAYSISDYGNFVLTYLKTNKINEVILLGHSFGGRIGIYLSINSPKVIRALILSGTPGLGKDLTAKERIYLFYAKIGKIFFYLPIISFFANFARKILYKLVGSYDYYKSNGNLRKTFQNIVAYRLESLLESINTPTLIIWGSEDKIVPVKVAFGMNKLIRNSEVSVINHARHGVPWTHPKEFANEIETFLSKVK